MQVKDQRPRNQQIVDHTDRPDGDEKPIPVTYKFGKKLAESECESADTGGHNSEHGERPTDTGDPQAV